ncbi:putative RNA-directed DNA polymerase from transposon X-element [Araneus ventricosus]|uniref:Putative RNA-directed DNA polymerase from transposon X-element n=1 Tax=Araneus ventricosus TaxID=182803 RepID=A0A4Y2PLC3_ARAVE|nr:putative RNA-directed DNA polymerase from transposon X-element [Araneus ventricosus]
MAFVSWNCHGFRNKSSELKDIINSYKPACIALQETYIKDNDTVNIRDYSIFSNTSSSARASGGVALAVANDIPSTCLNLNTNLQADAVRMHIKSLITICSLYLPPHQTIHQTELNNLISQLPSPFLILGDLNSHSPLWGGTEMNSRGRQIEQLLADHISSPKEIADTIASSLAQISSSRNYPDHFLAHKLKEEETRLNFNTPADLPYNNSFTFSEFQSCLSTVRNSSPAPDNISYILIKHLSIESQKNILRLYNAIWQEQTFPTLWHQTIIIPILKPGKDATNPLNYRPKVLTCCLCKLLERLVNRRLVHNLETNNIIHPHQIDFRKGPCSLDNRLSLETDIRLAFLQKKHLVAIFFDIEKAYNRTWKHGVLGDLYAFGLRGNLPIFIQNFLKLRKFRVRVGFEFSDSCIQEEGVPQRSVLSVSLFIVKVNNILNQLPSFVKGHLYVDNLYIFHVQGTIFLLWSDNFKLRLEKSNTGLILMVLTFLHSSLQVFTFFVKGVFT